MQGNGKHVLMALSGGVDSAVCVRLLQQAGHQVSGLVIRFSPAHQPAVDAAQRAALELGIPLEVADCQERFAREVIEPFCRDYTEGRTPNPCVVCNPMVKFHVLAQQADHMGIPLLATGHYARIVQQDGVYRVACAQSEARDQSYMLYRLPQPTLSRLLLPAGELEKPQIRALATEFGLSSAETPDSQEICFIPDGDYATYIARRGYPDKPGHFFGPDGQDLGPHKGIVHYTVGQRRGLGVSLGQPAFVKSIGGDGSVHLAYADDLWASAITLTDTVPVDEPLPDGYYQVKIRSMAKRVPCRLVGNALGFAQPQRAPAPGQHAVLYQDGVVMGGGVIAAVQYGSNGGST